MGRGCEYHHTKVSHSHQPPIYHSGTRAIWQVVLMVRSRQGEPACECLRLHLEM